MKLHQLDRSGVPDQSFMVSHNVYKNFLKVWHFHEQLELVYIVQSSGVRFIGDSIDRFDEGDIVLTGKNLPHMWLSNDQYFKKNSVLKAEAISIHFKEDFLGNLFFNTPELSLVGNMFRMANRGIIFKNVSPGIKEDFVALISAEPDEQLIKLIELLNNLSKVSQYHVLASKGYVNNAYSEESDRLAGMYEYIFQNFNSPIKSSDLAELMHMNNSAFSRFFKRIHRKTFTKYLNEIRIGYACKLLLSAEENITTICYLSGFNNVSNFNRQFKLIKGYSPRDFLNKHSASKIEG